MAVALGIDIGTSGTKTLAIDETGRILASASSEYPCSHPQPGWSEQDPELWWRATCETIRAVLHRGGLKPEDIGGVGLSGQMHGSVFLDESGNVLRPALLWNDQRTVAECAEITRLAGGHDALVGMVANPAVTGFTAPKILWLRNAEPHNYQRLRQVLLPKDYVRYRLSGTYATEVSDASGTLLLDVKNRAWSHELVSKLGLDASILPPCYESHVISAEVSSKGAAECGLAVGTPIVGGAGDQPASAVGNGIVRGGIVSATLGTSGVVFAHADTPDFGPAGKLQAGCHAVAGAWHTMGVVLSAGGAMQWLRNHLGQLEMAEAQRRGVDPYEILTEEAQRATAGCEGLVFLPYLTGERTPHFDPYARGGWIGLTVRHERSHVIRAVMEGVTFAMRDSLELVRASGVQPKQIRLSGGGARSRFWRQMQADIYGSEVATINAAEGPAFGVGLLAFVGTGVYANVPEACDATIREVERIAPNRDLTKAYDTAFAHYRAAYTSLKPLFHEMAKD
ncbi:xylulokinase [bacterium]|nr:xylulokinase [bacterium]